MADHTKTPPRVRIIWENCEYRGEGNANLVIRLIQENKVLRLIKDCDKNGLFMTKQAVEAKLTSYTGYVKNVIQPLMGNFIADPEIISLSVEEIRTINRVCEHKRPADRCHRWISENSNWAILLPDFCSIPINLSTGISGKKKSRTLSVEIKPKQGFISNCNTTKSEESYCRYCLKQNVKIKSGSIKSKSGYCPLDLFSGCPVRMDQALKELLLCPQNNLKLFLDQRDVFCEEDIADNLVLSLCSFFEMNVNSESAKEEFIHLVVQSLLADFEGNSILSGNTPNGASGVCQRTPTINCATGTECPHYLPHSCVLNRILQVQKLGKSEAELVYPFITASETDNSIKSDLFLQGCYPDYILPKHVGLENANQNESTREFQSRKIWEFLVSMTAKDCSIMLVYQKLGDGDRAPTCNVVKDSSGNPYFHSVAVVDLDPKSVQRIEGTFMDNLQMWKTHAECTKQASN